MPRPDFAAEERLMQRLDEEQEAERQRVRAVILEAGRSDVVADLDTKFKEIRTGVTQARSLWHSISDA